MGMDLTLLPNSETDLTISANPSMPMLPQHYQLN